jgi:transcriptional regulator GlxA family with amidase domain
VFTDYLARLRVERAKQMLQDPNRRVSEVAFEVGFLSLPHFNRSFKRIAGTTPTLWRQG